jgi:hypothetical protein
VIELLLLLALSGPAVRPHDATPGVTRALSRTAVCSTRWGLDRRAVTVTMKKHVAAAYGIPWDKHSLYEFDHLIPRELGGADDERNLWPQPWTGPHNAHMKDRLENALHRKVCAGEMTLAFAQQAIREDWIAAYRLHVSSK